MSVLCKLWQCSFTIYSWDLVSRRHVHGDSTVYCTVDEDRRIYYSTLCSLFSMCLAAVLVSFHHVFELTNSLFLYLLNVCVFSSGSSHNSNFLYFFLPQLWFCKLSNKEILSFFILCYYIHYYIFLYFSPPYSNSVKCLLKKWYHSLFYFFYIHYSIFLYSSLSPINSNSVKCLLKKFYLSLFFLCHPLTLIL